MNFSSKKRNSPPRYPHRPRGNPVVNAIDPRRTDLALPIEPPVSTSSPLSLPSSLSAISAHRCGRSHGNAKSHARLTAVRFRDCDFGEPQPRRRRELADSLASSRKHRSRDRDFDRNAFCSSDRNFLPFLRFVVPPRVSDIGICLFRFVLSRKEIFQVFIREEKNSMNHRSIQPLPLMLPLQSH